MFIKPSTETLDKIAQHVAGCDQCATRLRKGKTVFFRADGTCLPGEKYPRWRDFDVFITPPPADWWYYVWPGDYRESAADWVRCSTREDVITSFAKANNESD